MTNNIIKFYSSHPENKNQLLYRPSAVKNDIPKWFLDKDKHKKNNNGMYELDFFKTQDGKSISHRIPSWKSCPAMLDIFLSGYYLYTPCDITIQRYDCECDDHSPHFVTFDDKWKDNNGSPAICFVRGKEDGLPTPEGYSEYTLTWRPNWFFQLPEGYTALATHPMNIPNLPFKTISGFMDSSNILSTPFGQIPFFIKKDWFGLIPAGTPYLQIIPIKNEQWTSDVIDQSDEEIKNLLIKKHNEYYIGNGITKYKEQDWLKKDYK